MAFDARAAAAALEPPSFTDLDGQQHPGRLVSIQQLMPIYPDIERFFSQDGFKLPADYEQFESFVTKVCALADLPADKLLALPQNILSAALTNILGCLRGRAKEAPAGAGPAPDEA